MGAAVALTVLLAALVAGIGFRTVDAGGVQRLRSAVAVWRTVPPALRQVTARPIVLAAYSIALTATVAGFFVLLWLAAAVGVDHPDDWQTAAPAGRPEIAATLSRGAHASRRAVRFWIAAMLVLAAFVAWRMGLFAPLRVAGVFDTFASFDHPFHVARLESLVRSLRHGEALRWVASHQGGYPAEFYPLGFAWFEALLWALGLGLVPLPVVHRVAVILLFLAPGLLFYVMARRDGWPPIVAVAAFALHVLVPGDMWAGGYSELVMVGLVANVAAALAVVAATVAASVAFATGSRRAAGVAAVAAAATVWCNPRHALGLAVCVGCAAVAAMWRSPWRHVTVQLLFITAAAALLAAPELVSLVRFRKLYYFVNYTSYGSVLDYVSASIDAVSVPGFVLAAAGFVAAWLAAPRHFVTRTAAVALVGYAAMTLVLSFFASSLIQQLETTRLMPVQRTLMIYLAAVGLYSATTVGFARTRFENHGPLAVQVIVLATLLLAYLGPERLMPFSSRGLFPVERSGVPEMATFQRELTVADREAPPGTAILVVGSAVDIHQQLWAPASLDRLFFYDEWMWYWHRQHRGPYDPERGSKYDPERFPELFEPAYLEAHGIGAVVVAAGEQPIADAAPALRRISEGTYGVYVTVHPVPVVTLAGRAPETLTIANQRITSAGASAGGEALVRHNWFPRWRAQVNGRTVPIAATDDGYMRVAIPAGRVELVLTYVLDRLDVGARVGALVGAAALLMMLRP